MITCAPTEAAGLLATSWPALMMLLPGLRDGQVIENDRVSAETDGTTSTAYIYFSNRYANLPIANTHREDLEE